MSGVPSASTPSNFAIHAFPPSAGLWNVTFACNPSPDLPLRLIIWTSLTPAPIPESVAFRSSTDTVGARFDIITLDDAVPAMEIAGADEEDKLGVDCDLMRGAGKLRVEGFEGPVGGENKVGVERLFA